MYNPKPNAELFDSHCHFDFEAFDAQQTAIWQECQRANITRLLIPGIHPVQWRRAERLCESMHGLYFACGIHPWSIKDSDNWLALIDNFLQSPRCVALGECGLDGSIDTPMELQLPIFEAQLQLACAHTRPLIIHAHRAHHLLQPLLKHYAPPKGGVIHAFSGSLELANSYIKLGFKLGIGGAITYPRASKTRHTVSQLALSDILLETDAPDMPLFGRQGQANSPLQLPEVARCLAQLRRDAGQPESEDEIFRQTTDNARQLFNV